MPRRDSRQAPPKLRLDVSCTFSFSRSVLPSAKPIRDVERAKGSAEMPSPEVPMKPGDRFSDRGVSKYPPNLRFRILSPVPKGAGMLVLRFKVKCQPDKTEQALAAF